MPSDEANINVKNKIDLNYLTNNSIKYKGNLSELLYNNTQYIILI